LTGVRVIVTVAGADAVVPSWTLKVNVSLADAVFVAGMFAPGV
jgi:hypothetical protein